MSGFGNKHYLQDFMSEFDISPKHMAAMLGRTVRNVHQWLSDQREVPSVVVSYIRVVRALSSRARAKELAAYKP